MDKGKCRDATSPNWKFPIQSAWPQASHEESGKERPGKLEDAMVAGPGKAAVGSEQRL